MSLPLAFKKQTAANKTDQPTAMGFQYDLENFVHKYLTSNLRYALRNRSAGWDNALLREKFDRANEHEFTEMLIAAGNLNVDWLLKATEGQSHFNKFRHDLREFASLPREPEAAPEPASVPVRPAPTIEERLAACEEWIRCLKLDLAKHRRDLDLLAGGHWP